ncbi:Protein CBG01590 [Caenorhabditis briggsae]|uniref:Centromere protein X n=2 Tax=Caenorhabditis briggsae TaxID=6238 RepID=A0AAE9AAG8_CAEBR|nr:Protein CBG01590 [Caenorhabditis briggsae]ULT96596.1 hypothetical protein L3Y34_004874 [Caenorhabditis briggsae]UMM29775.1 hypothetical protein L5515_011972 [Caenorhabditis briggsae]CAP23016.1 Protein CBG01590 [Caenorhabditis briggsae]
MTMHIKQSTVRSILTVARRGKKRLNLDSDALAVLTALINLLAQETIARTCQTAANTGDRHVTRDHLKRIIAQIMLDFAV